MGGALLHGSGQRQQGVFTDVLRIHAGHLRLADGQRAGFIEGDVLDLTQLLQRRAALNQRPRRAAAASPEVIAAGVEITSAHGQPISSSVSPL